MYDFAVSLIVSTEKGPAAWLYVLRNQLVHGGATYQSRMNRDQVRDGKRMLLELVPVFVEVMFDEEIDWGPIYYPVIN